jgi:hypothetical protein
MTAGGSLDRARGVFARQAWGEAYAQLSAAGRDAALAPEDLERLAIAAHLVGRDAEATEAVSEKAATQTAARTTRRMGSILSPLPGRCFRNRPFGRVRSLGQ